ncbi:inactive receptor-like serine/threonine-protein kinase At2g40270 isoform X2 [Mercurialis annua]|uniref:inactive receptor-like serine/threonine-protein kinase At2g40270 isoform X2 n=1 Tax=Mercurialis annua TaxID=3986 RepID=UPI00215F34C2|nr:inactive receptor-like serine/threonine-protein kinase At2g40270 isoform X2 [Mercurialis annua]
MEKKNWKFSRFGVLILFLLCQNLILCYSLHDEGLALLKFKEKIKSDPFGGLKNWKNDKDGVLDHCSWFGVECSEGKVIMLNLKDLCLGGTLASDLRNLVHIKSIILRNNSFTGIIPEGIGEMKELEMLDFGHNNFNAPLPHDLVDNLSLTILLLDNNRLLVDLSPEIHQLKTLSEFQADENHLSNAAKGSSRNMGSFTWNDAQTESTISRRQLQQVSARHESPYLRGRFFLPVPSPSEFINDPPIAQPPPPSLNEPPIVVPSPAAPSPSNSDVNATLPSPQHQPNASSPSPNASTSNPLLVPPPPLSTNSPKKSSSSNHGAKIGGAIGGALFLVFAIGGIYYCKFNKATVKPWATGLSGQLQKAFITGVPKLKRSELEAGCEDFSNVIGSSPIGTLYKGTLSSGVEIAVASVAVTSSKDWPKNLEVHFRKKIETLSKVNHKNFINLIGYCEENEPFTRMLVFEYAPNGTLFEHLHIKESEHLDWGMRLRIAMGMAYCLEHMHQLDPPITHNNLTSSAVSLTEDYASKISDFSFSNVITATEMEGTSKFLDAPTALPESNVYSFGVLLFEMVTGRLPYSVDNNSLEDWAADYLRGDQPLKDMVDPTLDSFEDEKLESIGNLIKSCVKPDPKHRPLMGEVSARLKEITGLNHDAVIPKLSPLWWAELEILSTDAV